MNGTLVQLLPLLIIVVLLYLVMIRPQQRRQRQMMNLQRQLTPGQRVMTNAGLFATVSAVEDDHVVLEVAPGVECRFTKAAVVQVVTPVSSGEPSSGEEASSSA